MLSLLIFASLARGAGLEPGTPRIISLHPAITENLFDLNLGTFVVGTTDFSDFPEEAKKIPRVGGHVVSREKILSLKPTHILSINSKFGVNNEMAKKLDIQLITLDWERLEDYQPSIVKLGEIFNQRELSQSLSDKWQTEWQSIARTSSSRRVFLQIQTNPLIGVGPKAFLSQILQKCGHENVLKSASLYPALNRETLARLNPEIVVALADDDSQKEKYKSFWQIHSPNSKLVIQHSTEIVKMSVRLPTQAKAFCEKLK